MKRLPYARARGVAPLAAALVVAFTLVAAGFLTGTLVLGWTINGHAATIKHRYRRVDRNTSLVRLAATTVRLAHQIGVAAAPLGAQVRTVRRQSVRILGYAGSIQGHASVIAGLVPSIDATVHQIDGSVHDIHGNVSAISRRVGSIHAGVLRADAIVGSIEGRVQSIAAHAASISRDAGAIVVHLAQVLGTTRGIRAGVVAINHRVDRIIDVVRGVRADLDAVLVEVGRPTAGDSNGYSAAGGRSINGHANAIDCSLLILGSDCGD